MAIGQGQRSLIRSTGALLLLTVAALAVIGFGAGMLGRGLNPGMPAGYMRVKDPVYRASFVIPSSWLANADGSGYASPDGKFRFSFGYDTRPWSSLDDLRLLPTHAVILQEQSFTSWLGDGDKYLVAITSAAEADPSLFEYQEYALIRAQDRGTYEFSVSGPPVPETTSQIDAILQAALESFELS